MLYLVESANGTTSITARKEADGSAAWTTPVDTPSVQAPVVAAGLVIVATQNDVRAFRASSGQLAWTAANISAHTTAPPQDKSFNNCPQSTLHVAFMLETTLAAAVGSNSLVVTASDAIYVLSLDDGSVLWHGTPGSVTGPTRNPVIVGHTLYVVDGGAGGTGRFAALTSP
jgi:outer membrane protein assembly factor BamB